MTFSYILRLLIEERSLTQKQLAKDLHIAVSTLGGYVQGTSEPDFDTLKRLAQYFEVSTDYLLDYRSGKATSHKEDDVLRVFRTMPSALQDVYLEQGKAILRITASSEHSDNNDK